MKKKIAQKLLLKYIDCNKVHKIIFDCLCADSTVLVGYNQKLVSLDSVLYGSSLYNLVKFRLVASKRRRACKATKKSLVFSKFYYQLMHKRVVLKGVLKFTLKQLQHVSV